MNLLMTIVTLAIGVLSMAAGAAKIAMVPEEAAFLGQFGLSNAMIITFGVVQLAGGVLMAVPATRPIGSFIVAAGFGVSVALLLAAGNVSFAAVSMVPFVLASWIGYRCHSDRRQSPVNERHS